MDINNDLQQINTFIKGMNTDVSDALMDSSQYRYAENVRLTTNTDENTGELRLIEGSELYSQIPEKYGTIVAMTSIRNLLIAITKKSMQGKHIEYVNGKTVTTQITKDGNYILVYDTETKSGWKEIFETLITDEPFGQHLSLVTRWESSNNVKLYIADGGAIMTVNLKDKYLVKGKENISSIVNQVLLPIQTSIYSNSGHFSGVKFQYTYRLYNMGNAATTTATLSTPIVLYTTTGGIDTSLIDVNKSIKVQIPDLSKSSYKYIQVFRISYVSNSTNPVVDVIYDGKISTIKTGLVDSGGSIGTISYEQFQSYQTFVIYPTVIESKEDRLFAANITDGQQNIDNTFQDIDLRALSTGDEQSTTDYNVQFDVNNILNYNEQYWHKTGSYMQAHPTANIIGGACEFISWEYTTKDVYIDEKNRKYNSLTNAIQENGLDQQIQSLRPGEVYRYGAVLYDKTGVRSSVKWIADIMIPYNNTQIPKYVGDTQSGLPIYKFTVYGIQFTVNWNNLQQKCGNKCSQIEIVRRERAHDDRITITQGIGGYPLQMYKKNSTTKLATICPSGILTTNKVVVSDLKHDDASVVIDDECYAVSNPKYLIFASPEYVYNSEDMQNILDKSRSNIVIQQNYSAHSPIAKKYELNYSGHPIYSLQTKDSLFNYGTLYSKLNVSDSEERMIAEIKSNSFGLFPPSKDALLWVSYNNIDIDQLFIDGERLFANPNSDSNVKVFMQHPQIYISSENVYGQNNKIINIGYAESPTYDSLINEGKFVPQQSTFNVGNVQYLGWSVPCLDRLQSYIENDINEGDLNDDRHLYMTYPIGSTGKCIIIEQNNTSDFCDMSKSSEVSANYSDFIKLPVLSLRSGNRTPYNGRASVDYSVYQSFGHSILASDTAPKAIFDGDCYPGVFTYNASHTWNEANCSKAMGQCSVYSVPLYSDIDLSATFGDLYTTIDSNYKYFLQDYAGKVSGNFEQGNDAYQYNSAYNGGQSATTYSAIAYTTLDNSLYDTRVFYSAVKNNNEHVDNWLSFSELNFIDVDSRFGQITNMRLFKDKLLFWQEHASGILSVNERTVVNDVDNNEIVIGSGGVLSRFDYISTVYGMKPYQYEAEIQSNTTQYWWDGYNKEILAYGGGMELIPLTKTKSLTNYINSYSESTKPVLAYDIKYDEILSHVVGDNSLVYNEQIQAFSSVYTFMPQHRAIAGNSLYLAELDKIYIWNKQHMNNYSLLFNKPVFPKVRIVVNKNNMYTKTFDNLTFGGRMYKGSLPTIANWSMERVDGEYIKGEHLNSPMHHLIFTFETPLKQMAMIRGDEATSVDEYDYRLAIPRNATNMLVTKIHGVLTYEKTEKRKSVQYGNRLRGKTMQCEIASDYNSTDFSLQYITTKFRMSWS